MRPQGGAGGWGRKLTEGRNGKKVSLPTLRCHSHTCVMTAGFDRSRWVGQRSGLGVWHACEVGVGTGRRQKRSLFE